MSLKKQIIEELTTGACARVEPEFPNSMTACEFNNPNAVKWDLFHGFRAATVSSSLDTEEFWSKINTIKKFMKQLFPNEYHASEVTVISKCGGHRNVHHPMWKIADQLDKDQIHTLLTLSGI